MKENKWRRRLLLLLCLLFTVFFSIYGLLGLAHYQRRKSFFINQESQLILDNVSLIVIDFFKDLQIYAQAQAGNKSLLKWFEQNNRQNPDTFFKLFEPLESRNYSWFLADLAGQKLYHQNHPMRSWTEIDPRYKKIAGRNAGRDSKSIDLGLAPTDSSWEAISAHSVSSPRQVHGVIGVTKKADHLISQFHEMAVFQNYPDSFIYFVKPTKEIAFYNLYHNQEKKLESLTQIIRLDEKSSRLLQKNGDFTTVIANDGQKRLVFSRYVPELDHYFIFSVPEKALTGQSLDLFVRFLPALLAPVLPGAAVFWFSIRRERFLLKQHAAQTALIDQDLKFWREIAARSADCLLLVNNKGELEYFNQNGGRLFSLAEKNIGKPVSQAPFLREKLSLFRLADHDRTWSSAPKDIQIGENLFYRFSAFSLTGLFEGHALLGADISEFFNLKKYLDLVLGSASDLIYVKDRDLRYQMASSALISLLGYSGPEQVIGRTDDELRGPATAVFFDKKHELTVLRDKKKLNFTEAIIRQEGKVGWLTTRKKPLYDLNGRLNGILSCSINITDTVDLENNLRQVMEFADTTIYVRDLNGVYKVCSQGYARLIGLKDWRSIVGLTDNDLNNVGREKLLGNQIDLRIVKSGQPELVSELINGRWFEIVKKPIFDKHGAVSAIITIAHDVTELRKLADQNRKLSDYFNLIMDHADIPIYLIDNDLKLVFCTKSFAAELGIDNRGAMEGLPIEVLFPKETAQSISQSIRECLERKIQINQRQRAVNFFNGQKRYYSSIRSPIIDSGGSVIGVLTTAQDLTRVRVLTEKLEESRDRGESILDALMDNTKSDILILNSDYNILNISRQMALRQGLNDWRLAKNTSVDRLEQDAVCRAAIDAYREADAKEDGGIIEKTLKVDLSDDTTNWMRINFFPLVDQADKTIGHIYLGSDITESVVIMNHLKEATDRAEVADRAKSDFLAKMSHEIRTPMNAVIGMTDMLSLTELNDLQSNYILAIKNSAASLLQIINDILDFSKIEAGKMEINEEVYEFAVLLKDIANLIGIRASEKKLAFFIDCDPNIPARLVGDSLRVKQILINLLGNAVKFTQKGFVKLSVRGKTSQNSISAISFDVRDTGPGIEAAEFERLFGEFQQINNSSHRQGTGLGLSISKKLVDMMDGKITVKSQVNKGSVFSFRIPQPPAEQSVLFAQVKEPLNKKLLAISGDKMLRDNLRKMIKDLKVDGRVFKDPSSLSRLKEKGYTHLLLDGQLLDESIPSLAEDPVEKACLVQPNAVNGQSLKSVDLFRPLFRPLTVNVLAAFLNNQKQSIGSRAENDTEEFTAPEARILVAEDNPVNRQVISGYLEICGISPDLAADGQAAVDAVKADSYDLIFMDHQMPGKDGIQATREIRLLNGDRFQRIPIIALTANALVGDRDKYLASGMNDYASKPLYLKDFKRLLRRWLPADLIQAGGSGKPPENRSGLNREVDLPRISGFEVIGAFNEFAMGREDLFDRLLTAFVKENRDIKEKLTRARAEDKELFIRIAHSLKSSAANLGGDCLSRSAKEMEKAGRNNDSQTISRKLGPFIAQVEQASREIKQYLDQKKASATVNRATADLSAAAKRLPDLISAADNLETSVCRTILGEWSGFQWPEDFNEFLENANSALDNYEFDELSGLASQFLQSI